MWILAYEIENGTAHVLYRSESLGLDDLNAKDEARKKAEELWGGDLSHLEQNKNPQLAWIEPLDT